MAHHIIFEGAELAGKSWLTSQVYNFLEPKYNQQKVILDGCHWFNCDLGFYGTEHGKIVIENYVNIFKELQEKNLLVEKMYLSDRIYNQLYRNQDINYAQVENRLSDLDFKMVLVTFPEDKELLQKRIDDRLRLYPHYARILKTPDWYISQQRKYKEEIENSKLPYLIIETEVLPDDSLTRKILDWIGEE
ncbi:MAG: hypothetical protein PHX30_03270 [Candidatus Pacebacteria bacterium]|jgi:hypothetical protein|nr:hypothetical protein [Candidatus Paceibacterota bacterium]